MRAVPPQFSYDRLGVLWSSRVPSMIVAFLDDLIFATKLSATATAVGTTVTIVRTLEELGGQLDSAAVELVMVDLSAGCDDPLEAIALARASSPEVQIVAFGPHVEGDLLNAARQRGADTVLARSAFVRKLPDLLAIGSDPRGESLEPGGLG